jgi:hypothetical protein
MIWFTCKKCGKTHSRPETSAGTLIFCDCGNGTTVPWESTASAPAAPPPVSGVPHVPDLAPIQFDPVPVSSTPAKPGAYLVSVPAAPVEDEERPYRRGRSEKRDPDYCFNHQRRPKAQACADCEENFCADCLVHFNGVPLCGPCKNFRARRLELPPTTSTMASASLIISLIAGPILMCLLIWTPGNSGMRVVGWLSLLPQVVAMALGAWALAEAEKEKKGGGQWVAVTGITIAAMTCLMTLLMQWFATRLASLV